MATAYRIDRFPFVFWDGDPPRFPSQVTQEIARPGVDGVSLRTLGRRGPTSVANLTSWHANWFLARRALLDYDTLVGLDVVTLDGRAIDDDGVVYVTGHATLLLRPRHDSEEKA